MIRKAIIATHMLAAVVFAVTWADSILRGPLDIAGFKIRGGWVCVWSSAYNGDPTVLSGNVVRSVELPGFKYVARHVAMGYYDVRASLSLVPVALMLAAYPTLTLVRGPLLRWRRRRKGLCLKCGYNLTGLPEPRCPECGMVFANATCGAKGSG